MIVMPPHISYVVKHNNSSGSSCGERYVIDWSRVNYPFVIFLAVAIFLVLYLSSSFLFKKIFNESKLDTFEKFGCVVVSGLLTSVIMLPIMYLVLYGVIEK